MKKTRLHTFNCKKCLTRSVGVRLNTSIICMRCKKVNEKVF